MSLAVLVVTAPFVDAALVHVTRTHSTNETMMLIEHHRRSMESGGPSAEVVLLGDSSLRSSVDPAIVAGRTGGTVENLGLVAGGGFASDQALLEAYLEHRTGRPRIVVLMHSAGLEAQSIDPSFYWSFLPSLSTTLGLYRARQIDDLQLIEALLRGTIRTYGYKEYVEPVMELLVFHGVEAFRAAGAENARFRADRRRSGYYPHHGTYDPSRGLQPSSGAYEPKIAPRNAYFLEQLLLSARREGIRVFYAHGPMYFADAELRAEDGYQETLTRELHRWRALGLETLYDHIPAFPAEEVGPQFNHLNPEGAASFSRWLGAALADHLDR